MGSNASTNGQIKAANGQIKALTFHQVAQLLCISRRTLNQWVADGKIRVTRLSPRTPRILESDLLEFINQSREER